MINQIRRWNYRLTLTKHHTINMGGLTVGVFLIHVKDPEKVRKKKESYERRKQNRVTATTTTTTTTTSDDDAIKDVITVMTPHRHQHPNEPL